MTKSSCQRAAALCLNPKFLQARTNTHIHTHTYEIRVISTPSQPHLWPPQLGERSHGNSSYYLTYGVLALYMCVCGCVTKREALFLAPVAFLIPPSISIPHHHHHHLSPLSTKFPFQFTPHRSLARVDKEKKAEEASLCTQAWMIPHIQYLYTRRNERGGYPAAVSAASQQLLYISVWALHFTANSNSSIQIQFRQLFCLYNICI